jgi:hypothetical protein
VENSLTPEEHQFLVDMIEHHQMGVVMSNEVLKTTDDDDIMFMAFSIIYQQKNEIETMKEMLKMRPKRDGVGTEEKSLRRTLGTILEAATPNKPSKDGDGDGFIVNPKTGKDNIPFKQNFKKQDSKKLKDAIVKSSPKMMQVKTKPWAAGDKGHAELMLELGASKKEIKLATSQEIPLEAFASTMVAAGNCGQASTDVGAFLIREGLAKEGEVFLREVGEPWYGNYEGTHFVTHVGPKDSDDAIIIDFTLRQFDADKDFPWIGTVREYRAQGYENKASLEDGEDRPQMGDESFDKILASGKVVYPWDKPGFKGDEDLK